MENYTEQTEAALWLARQRFATMCNHEERTGTRAAGYEELRVAIRHLEELHADLSEG